MKRLNQMGIVELRNTGRSLMFRRNDAYLEWREVTQIAEDHSVQDLVKQVRELEAKEAERKENSTSKDRIPPRYTDQTATGQHMN